jgi:hypothetical protein
MSPMPARCFRPTTAAATAAVLVLLATALTGCRRSEEAYDDRPLEKRSHVETVQPVDRKDAFRP